LERSTHQFSGLFSRAARKPLDGIAVSICHLGAMDGNASALEFIIQIQHESFPPVLPTPLLAFAADKGEPLKH
jgi:hypothetical protein